MSRPASSASADAPGNVVPLADAGDVRDAVIEGARRCLESPGIDRMTMDDVARASGISRATLYRHFGSKDAILRALFERVSVPFEDEVRRQLGAAASFACRIEEMLVWAVAEHLRNPVSAAALGGGPSRATLELFDAVFRERCAGLLRPAFAAARASGELRPELDPEEAADWLLRELLVLFAERHADEARLRRRVRHYVLPVFCPEAGSPVPPPAALAALARRATALEALLDELKAELRRLGG